MDKLQQQIHYKFNNIEFLNQALAHKSFCKVNNERLEFLGDSILGAVIASEVYNAFTHIDEGKLTRLKSHLVRGTTLTEIAYELGLSKHIKLGRSEAKSGGFRRASILADSVEAIIGAVFIDSNFKNAKQVVLQMYQARLKNLDLNLELKDDKTVLQEYLQKYKKQLPRYKLVSTTGKDHNSTFTVECFVPDYNLSTKQNAKSIKRAEQICAKILLPQLKL